MSEQPNWAKKRADWHGHTIWFDLEKYICTELGWQGNWQGVNGASRWVTYMKGSYKEGFVVTDLDNLIVENE